MAKGDTQRRRDERSDVAPQLALTHGQTLWLMGELGLRQGVSVSTFNYYIKALRKIGIPFAKGKGQSEGRRHVKYDFEELMELTLALLLRVYGWLPDEVAAGLRAYRNELRPIYRQAYQDSLRRLHPCARLSVVKGDQAKVEGLFLDLNIRYAAGRMINFGPPRAISAFEAMCAYANSDSPSRAYLPLNVTVLAETIVGAGREAPSIRRGRGAGHGSPTTTS
ncbi:hypothetical protein [Rhodoblastus sp.]|uniref:hypothetical protein n=1 Tax=Rhodoblastus sp. TaxID=1962975 RepID=UPI002614D372|nr:hypothetical protein [Rhodoblastus sp.]